MGHYVISRVTGFRTGDVTLELLGTTFEHKGGAETTLPTCVTSLGDLEVYLEGRIQILFAGVQAQTLPVAHPDKTVDSDEAVKLSKDPAGGAGSDFAKVRELIHILRNIRHPGTDASDKKACDAQLQAIDRDLWNRAAQLVECHAKTIIGLAANLANRVERIRTEYRIEAAELEVLEAVKALTAN
jgi:hypothetical protein